MMAVNVTSVIGPSTRTSSCRTVCSTLAMAIITAVNEIVVSGMSHRVLQTFSIMHIGEVKILLLNKTKKPVCVRENMYDVIGSIHQDLHHAGYKKDSYITRKLIVVCSICTR